MNDIHTFFPLYISFLNTFSFSDVRSLKLFEKEYKFEQVVEIC